MKVNHNSTLAQDLLGTIDHAEYTSTNGVTTMLLYYSDGKFLTLSADPDGKRLAWGRGLWSSITSAGV